MDSNEQTVQNQTSNSSSVSASTVQMSIKDKLLVELKRLDSLTIEDAAFIDALDNLSKILTTANPRDVQQACQELDLTNLFHCVNSLPDEKIFEEHLRTFGRFLESLSINEMFSKYFDCILQGLNAKNIVVLEIWLKKIVKPLFSSEGLLKNTLPKTEINRIIKFVIRLLLCRNTSISCTSHDILTYAAKSLREEFFTDEVLDTFKKTKDHEFSSEKDRDEFMIRFYSVFVEIASISPVLLDIVKNNGYFDKMLEYSKAKLEMDTLIAFNIIKLYTDLASTTYGLEYIENSTPILSFITKKILDFDDFNSIEAMVFPGYVNFFIKVAQLNSDVLKQYSPVMDKLIQYCKEENTPDDLKILTIESVAFLCNKTEYKLYFADKMKIFLDRIAAIINGCKMDWKERTLLALNEIFEVNGADPESKATILTEQWYQYLNSLNCGLERFIILAQEPFLEVRIPSINFIRILATTIWGQKVLAQQKGFLDYLLNRSTESTKEGREAKFAVVRELVVSPFIRLSFQPEEHLRIRAYFKNGAIYKEANVAMESS